MMDVVITGLKSKLQCKIVHAYGLDFFVPWGTKYLTINSKGLVEYWFVKPKPNTGFGDWRDSKLHTGYCIAVVAYNGDWVNSLREFS